MTPTKIRNLKVALENRRKELQDCLDNPEVVFRYRWADVWVSGCCLKAIKKVWISEKLFVDAILRDLEH